MKPSSPIREFGKGNLREPDLSDATVDQGSGSLNRSMIVKMHCHIFMTRVKTSSSVSCNIRMALCRSKEGSTSYPPCYKVIMMTGLKGNTPIIYLLL